MSTLYTPPLAVQDVYSDLRICALDREQHGRTCGYWYTVTHKAMAHTAMRTRPEVERWLAVRGLQLHEPLPKERGTFRSQTIIGEYVRACWLDVRRFWDLMPRRERIIPVLSNGEYTLGIVTTDDQGRRVVNYLNVNVQRTILDYKRAELELGRAREGVTG